MAYTYPNRVVAALDATASAASKTGQNFDSSLGRGLIVVCDTTTLTAGSITYTVEGFDEISGKYYTLVASAALVAAGTVVLRVYPGLTAAANLTVSDITPNKVRVRATVVTGPATYTVAAYVVE